MENFQEVLQESENILFGGGGGRIETGEETLVIKNGTILATHLEESSNFNETFCFFYNLTQLEEMDIVERCAELRPSIPIGLMTIIQIFYALVCMVGLVGNSLVIYVVLRYSKMQTVTNMYILNLALADECFLVGIPFLIVTSASDSWIFGKAMCKVYLTTTSINQFTSSIFLTVMSADRYIAVCHPISSPRFRTSVIARIVSLTAWATSALLMVPVFLYATTITNRFGRESCNMFWPLDSDDISSTVLEVTAKNMSNFDSHNMTTHGEGESTTSINGQTAFTVYSFVLSFAVPLMLIMIFYILVIFKLRTVGPKNKSKEKKKSHRKVTRLVLTVITVYILCWLPYWMSQLFLIFTETGHFPMEVIMGVNMLAGCLSYSNSAMNPVLYAFLSENFKKSFMKAISCLTGRGANGANNIILHQENSAFPIGKSRRRQLRDAKGHHHGQGADHKKDHKRDGPDCGQNSNGVVPSSRFMSTAGGGDHTNGMSSSIMNGGVNHNHQDHEKLQPHEGNHRLLLNGNRVKRIIRVEDSDGIQSINDISSGGMTTFTRSIYNESSSSAMTTSTTLRSGVSTAGNSVVCRDLPSTNSPESNMVVINHQDSSINGNNEPRIKTVTSVKNGNLAPPSVTSGPQTSV